MHVTTNERLICAKIQHRLKMGRQANVIFVNKLAPMLLVLQCKHIFCVVHT